MEKIKRLNLDQLKLLAHPLRQRILTTFASGEPLSVQELAQRLQLPHGKVYYHVQRLVAGELLTECGQRSVNGIVERLYEPAAASFTVADAELRDLPGYHALTASLTDSTLSRVVEIYRQFQQVRAERAAANRRSRSGADQEQAGFSASFVDLMLTEEEAKELDRQITDLLDRYQAQQRLRRESGESRAPAPSLRRVQYVVLAFTNLPYDSPLDQR